MNTIDLTPYQITRPEKIVWRFSSPTSDDVLEGIKSKSLKTFLRTVDEKLATHNIRYEYKPLSVSEFEAWLPYYQAKMSENEYQIIATMEWYQDRISKGLSIECLFFYQNETLVASGIITRKGQEKATIAFKASDRLDLSGKSNSSIGAVVDYYFLQEMHKQGVKIISAGRSKNAFGVANNIGYLDYKLKFGFVPQPAETAPLLTEAPTNEEGVVLFYGLKDGTLSLYAFTPTSHNQPFEPARFATPDLPFLEIKY